jgi:hypothetical protein
MKAILCLLMTFLGITTTAGAQNALPTSGPSFSAKDTTKAEAISVATLQTYPVGIDRESVVVEDSSQAQQTVIEGESIVIEGSIDTKQSVTQKPATTDGPIRAWSNPPGYTGSQKPVTMTKHKSSKRFKRGKSKKGCPTF